MIHLNFQATLTCLVHASPITTRQNSRACFSYVCLFERYKTNSHHRSGIYSAGSSVFKTENEGCRQKSAYLTEYNGWRVRDAEGREDLKAVAAIQSKVFYEPSAFGALDGMFFDFFKAEVYDLLLQKVKYTASKSYACLMAFPSPKDNVTLPDDSESVVGVVDLTVLSEKDVLQHLEGASDYLYVSGMAVDENERQSKVATALLRAVEERALEWRYEYLVLHVHEDNIPARKLYQKAGYLALNLDPLWSTKLLGRKRKILLAKRTNGYLSAAQSNAAGR